MPPTPSSPSVTVRAFAEMIELPTYQLLPKLHDQKYPRDAPAYYRVPFYREALATIRAFYRHGRRSKVLEDAIARIRTSATMADRRKEPNIRLIRAFQSSSQTKRPLSVQSLETFKDTLNGVTLRYRPDLIATDGQQSILILYNTRQAPIPPALARMTLELVHNILSRQNQNMANTIIELVDLAFKKKVYTVQGIRPLTLRKAQQSARAIAHLWGQI